MTPFDSAKETWVQRVIADADGSLAPVSLTSAKTAWVVVRLKTAQVAMGCGTHGR